ncbi:MAG: phosphohistidine phosphatase SixA [Leptospiraceae bacterium]|nr:phosphohistidine phosphatase SixA [Leptospiraceae bacterium]MBK7055217.1 phosphohistidine phosphatase SixA [Leptospiraceae bacterium]MBK9497838.1 phosphohistidine phosphatase SixA [Leptospiraceae bacterium]MBP9164990.1 phosphohistidine phosphatase SixA [Leptospiraceae bacterium]
MKLIIARHGEAESFSATGLDRDRKLTENGKTDLVKMANFIYNSPLRVTQILYSPYLRTQETADIYSSTLQFKGVATPADELLPSNDYSDLLPKLNQLSNSDTVLLIGHNPDVSFFAARLIRDESISRSLVFSPGSTIAINIAKENFLMGQIIWMISPEFLKT